MAFACETKTTVFDTICLCLPRFSAKQVCQHMPYLLFLWLRARIFFSQLLLGLTHECERPCQTNGFAWKWAVAGYTMWYLNLQPFSLGKWWSYMINPRIWVEFPMVSHAKMSPGADSWSSLCTVDAWSLSARARSLSLYGERERETEREREYIIETDTMISLYWMNVNYIK